MREAEYDQYITDQQKLFDSLVEDYTTILNQRLDNLDYLVETMIAEINANSATINSTITAEVEAVGYTLSESMKTIWDTSTNTLTSSLTNSANTNGDKIKNVITTYGDKFNTAITTTNTALNQIATNVRNMITQLNKVAKTNVAAAGSSSAATSKPSTSTTTSKPASTTTSKPKTGTGSGTPEVGDQVTYNSGWYYYDSTGTSPAGYHNRGGKVYITKINNASWATHPYHISTGNRLGSGDLGWLKLNQISGYAAGKKLVENSEYAWTQEQGNEIIVRPSDGAILTPLAKNDSVLNAAASKNIWDMANNPSDFIKNNLGLGETGTPVGGTGNTSVNQNFEQIVFSFPQVKNYDQMLKAMQKDNKFQNLIQAITIDQVAGKSKLSVSKALR